jgi:hypothetical protein
MRPMKLIGAASLAVLVLCAVGVTTASAAAPEFKVTGGGKLPSKFTWSGGLALLQTKVVSSSCTGSKATGEITSEKAGTATITLAKCTALGSSCQNNGTPKSGIVTLTTPFDLVWLSETPLIAGILFLPENKTTNRFVTFTCETSTTTTVEVRANNVASTDGGGLLCEITPLNTLTTKYTLTCAGSSADNTWREYKLALGGTAFPAFLEASINMSAFQLAGLVLTAAVETEKDMEIVA